MVLRAILIGIVGEFMVVPHRDHRQYLVQALQIRILAIGRIAETIIGKLNDLGGRTYHPSGQGLVFRRIGSHRIFINIVAGVDHQVERIILRRMGISVEISERQVGAADHPDSELGGFSLRQGPGAADRRPGAIGRNEAIEIPAVRVETVGGDLGDMVAVGQRLDLAGNLGTGKICLRGDFRRQLHIAIADIAGPEQHRILRRFAARHTMGKALRADQRRRSRDAERPEAECSQSHQLAAIDVHGHAFIPKCLERAK